MDQNIEDNNSQNSQNIKTASSFEKVEKKNGSDENNGSSPQHSSIISPFEQVEGNTEQEQQFIQQQLQYKIQEQYVQQQEALQQNLIKKENVNLEQENIQVDQQQENIGNQEQQQGLLKDEQNQLNSNIDNKFNNQNEQPQQEIQNQDQMQNTELNLDQNQNQSNYVQDEQETQQDLEITDQNQQFQEEIKEENTQLIQDHVQLIEDQQVIKEDQKEENMQQDINLEDNTELLEDNQEDNDNQQLLGQSENKQFEEENQQNQQEENEILVQQKGLQQNQDQNQQIQQEEILNNYQNQQQEQQEEQEELSDQENLLQNDNQQSQKEEEEQKQQNNNEINIQEVVQEQYVQDQEKAIQQQDTLPDNQYEDKDKKSLLISDPFQNNQQVQQKNLTLEEIKKAQEILKVKMSEAEINKKQIEHILQVPSFQDSKLDEQQRKNMLDQQNNLQNDYQQISKTDQKLGDTKIRKQIFNQPYFKQIVDVSDAIQQGNMVPALISLKEGFQDVNYVDQFGFTLLHHCATNNFRDIALFLLKLKVNINALNQQNQTALMMTCNYGWMELFKILMDHNAIVNQKDIFQFSPLLYAVKSNSHAIFYYLLYKGADINEVDGNRSGLAHWCAFNNNIFLLKFLRAINMDLNFADNEGKLPIERAVYNTAYKCIKLLAFQYPESIPDLDYVKKLSTSPSIQKILREAKYEYIKSQNHQYQKYYTIVKNNVKFVTFILYLVLYGILASVFAYSNHLAQTRVQHSSFISLNIVLYLIFLFQITYIYIFLFVTTSKFGEGRHLLEDSLIDRKNRLKGERIDNFQPYLLNIDFNDYKYLNWNNIDKLFANQKKRKQFNQYQSIIENDIDEEGQVQNKLQPENINFLQEIVILFESGHFNALKSYDFDQICSQCMKYQPKGTSHCDICDICVPHFSHHSFWFNKCINQENWLFYYVLLLGQQFLLTLFFILIIRNHWGYVSQNYILVPLETFYYMYQKESIANALGYVFAMFIYYKNSLDLIIETYGLFNDLSRHQILHTISNLRYLYTPRINQKGHIILQKTGLKSVKIRFLRCLLHTKIK